MAWAISEVTLVLKMVTAKEHDIFEVLRKLYETFTI